MSKLDLRNRAPECQRLADSRLRVVRRFDLLNFVPKTPAQLLADVWLAWGTADAEFTNCRLIKQDVGPQGFEFPDDSKRPATLTRVYEEISEFAETKVGNDDVSVDQYGYKIVTINHIQFSAGTASYGIPGTTTGPAPWGALILRDQVDTDDGTLRTIKRTYIEGGLLADDQELKFGGRLLLRTLKSLQVEPTTPAGYTLVTRSTEYVNGLKLFRYGYAAGGGTPAGTGGEISRSVQYNISPDQGATGVTVTRIVYLSDLSVTTNPITGPAGSELIEVNYQDEAGYRTWNATYAEGTGLITQDVDIRNGGKLVVYTRTSINAVPTTPSATIGGTVTLISDKQRNGTDAANGTIIYDRQWAEGVGEISRSFSNSQGGAVAFDPAAPTSSIGAVICSIKYITALSVTADPTTPPGSFVRVAIDFDDADGYRIWNVRFAYGAGTVATKTDLRNFGKLVVYSVTALGAAPAQPASTIGGTVVQISSSLRHDSGYDIYDYQWAEGYGIISERIAVRDGGLRIQAFTSLSAGTAALFIPAGIPITKDKDLIEGAIKWDVACLQNNAGGDPTVGTALTFEDYVNFTFPGRAKLYGVSFPLWSSGTGYVYDVFKSPPIQIQVVATTEITYQTSAALGSLTYPLWNPTDWATVRANYQGTDAYAKADVTTLYGYLYAGTNALSYTAPAYPSSVSILGINALQNSSGSINLSGGPSDPSGTTVTLMAKVEPAFTAFDGTQYYRKTVVYATIPTQPALPV